jgi:hypothetical protein
MGMNSQYVKDLMVGLRDEKLKGKIGEQLRQICDLSKAMDIVHACFTKRCVFRSKKATLSEQTGRPFGAK